MFRIRNFKSIRILLFVLILILVIALLLRNFHKKNNNLIHNKNINEEKVVPGQIKNISSSDEAPEIKNTGKWINTDADLTLESLRGKVVLIEFWTFGCYNCQNTLPYLNKWYDKYKSQNFEMIGIHCPEFDNERNFDNVKKNVAELGIKYPVLTDNEFSVWQKYEVNAWPTIFLIDKKGEIRYSKVGEGSYNKTEETINKLLNENYSQQN